MGTTLSKTNKEKLRKKLRAFGYKSVETRNALANLQDKLNRDTGLYGYESVELEYVEDVSENGDCVVSYDRDDCDCVQAFVAYGVTNTPKLVGYPNLMTRETCA